MYTYMKIIPYFIIIIILYDIHSNIHLCINIVTSYFCVIEILILRFPCSVSCWRLGLLFLKDSIIRRNRDLGSGDIPQRLLDKRKDGI